MAQMSRNEALQILENDTDITRMMNELNVDINPLEQGRQRHRLERLENILSDGIVGISASSQEPLLFGRPIAPSSTFERIPRRFNYAPPAPRRSSLVDLPSPAVVATTGCSHTLSRGPRIGQNCNKRFYRNSEYCRTHYRRYNPISPAIISPPRPATRPAVYADVDDIKENHTHLIYKSCAICNHKTEGPKVVLECECEYHLNCFMMVQHEKNCFKCGDKIHKQDKDYQDCSICLEKVKTNKVKTSCGHNFHRHCLNAWSRIGRGVNTDKCPNCRADL